MVRIDDRVARSFTLLKNPEFAVLLAYWRAQLDDVTAEMISASDDRRIRQLQGKAVYIKELLDSVDGSHQLLEKLKRS